MRANVDRSQVQKAMQKLAAEQAQRQEEKRQLERELAAVKVCMLAHLSSSSTAGCSLPPRHGPCCNPKGCLVAATLPSLRHCAGGWLLQVVKEDIELIAQQFDMDKKKAERCLRENKGDVKAAMQSLLKV